MSYNSQSIKSKEFDFNRKILLISKLFNKLLNIYKDQFTNDLLWLLFPNIDIIKLNLFKKSILEIFKYKYIYLEKLYNNFFIEFNNDILKSTNNSTSISLLLLLLKKYWITILEPIETIEHKDKRKLIFYFNNWLNNLSLQPHLLINFKLDVINIPIIKNNFLNGIKNCLTDLITNQGYLNIKFNNKSAFEIGKNLAKSKGKVIYKNDLIELIQYLPTTSNIFQAPLLFIPPCINKYYILDLSDHNSLVKWMINKGFTVYIISWINPDLTFAHKTFADYIINGPLKAVNIIKHVTKSQEIHLAGYCMGGVMLSCLLSYIQQTNSQNNNIKILSATHFMSLIDFANFKNLNKYYLNKLQHITNNTGYLDGKLLSMAFNVAHANELVWPYFINYYLLNESLNKFDALYWNCDPINLPANMYNFYLLNICFENKLCQSNAIKINGIAIDLSKVTVPIFVVAGEKDRISPWEIAYNSLKIYSSSLNKQFVLSSAGHVTSLINSPINQQYSYKYIKQDQINNLIDPSPNIWLQHASQSTGSWWPCWLHWLKNIDSTQIKATDVYNNSTINFENKLLLTEAPGNYVFNYLK